MSKTYNISNINSDTPQPDNVIIYWLGSASFAFKFATGEVVCIDPYLSDAIERMFGLKRLSLAPVLPEDLHFDHLLFTHDHADHLDPDSFDALIAANAGCRIIAASCCAEYLDSKGVTFDNAVPGTTFQCGGIEIGVVDADHGELCATAVGFLIKFGEHCIYFTGDTAYNESIMAPIIADAPDIVIPCINGAFGNMSEGEAANLVAQCGAKVTTPSHFWLFSEQGGCPAEFKKQLYAQSPDTNFILFTPGRGQEISA